MAEQYLCPHCGYDLSKSIGEQLAYTQVRTKNGTYSGEFGNIQEYYCPECGATLSDELGNAVSEKFFE